MSVPLGEGTGLVLMDRDLRNILGSAGDLDPVDGAPRLSEILEVELIHRLRNAAGVLRDTPHPDGIVIGVHEVRGRTRSIRMERHGPLCALRTQQQVPPFSQVSDPTMVLRTLRMRVGVPGADPVRTICRNLQRVTAARDVTAFRPVGTGWEQLGAVPMPNAKLQDLLSALPADYLAKFFEFSQIRTYEGGRIAPAPLDLTDHAKAYLAEIHEFLDIEQQWHRQISDIFATNCFAILCAHDTHSKLGYFFLSMEDGFTLADDVVASLGFFASMADVTRVFATPTT